MFSYFFKKISIQRYLFNKWLKTITLNDSTLDLASGGSSYSKFLKGNFYLTRADYNEAKNVDIVMDFNEKFPFCDESFQNILLFNAIYIAPKPENTIRECHRVLKKGGKLFITFPVVFNEVPEPKDYHRFTKDRISLLCADSTDVKITPIGNRVYSSLYIIEPLLRFKILKALYIFLTIPFYIINKKFSKGFVDFPIFYAVELTK